MFCVLPDDVDGPLYLALPFHCTPLGGGASFLSSSLNQDRMLVSAQVAALLAEECPLRTISGHVQALQRRFPALAGEMQQIVTSVIDAGYLVPVWPVPRDKHDCGPERPQAITSMVIGPLDDWGFDSGRADATVLLEAARELQSGQTLVLMAATAPDQAASALLNDLEDECARRNVSLRLVGSVQRPPISSVAQGQQGWDTIQCSDQAADLRNAAVRLLSPGGSLWIHASSLHELAAVGELSDRMERHAEIIGTPFRELLSSASQMESSEWGLSLPLREAFFFGSSVIAVSGEGMRRSGLPCVSPRLGVFPMEIKLRFERSGGVDVQISDSLPDAWSAPPSVLAIGHCALPVPFLPCMGAARSLSLLMPVLCPGGLFAARQSEAGAADDLPSPIPPVLGWTVEDMLTVVIRRGLKNTIRKAPDRRLKELGQLLQQWAAADAPEFWDCLAHLAIEYLGEQSQRIAQAMARAPSSMQQNFARVIPQVLMSLSKRMENRTFPAPAEMSGRPLPWIQESCRGLVHRVGIFLEAWPEASQTAPGPGRDSGDRLREAACPQPVPSSNGAACAH